MLKNYSGIFGEHCSLNIPIMPQCQIIHNYQVLQQKVETVRIGDRLTFRIEIPEKTPYGIFARCEDNKRGEELILQYWKKY